MLKYVASHLQVDFDVSSRDFSWDDRMNWWESMRPWFLERGYILYHQNWVLDKDFGECLASLSPRSVSCVPQEHPYSFTGGGWRDSETPEFNQYINVCTLKVFTTVALTFLSWIGSSRMCPRPSKSSRYHQTDEGRV